MNAILASTKNETFKIFSKKKYVFLFSSSILISILVSAVNLLADRRLGGPILNNGTIPITVLNLMSSLVLPLFILMLTSDLFSGEFSDNSIIMSLVRPITRNKLYISKILAVGVSIFLLLLGTFVISVITSFMGGDLNSCLIKLPSNFITYAFAIVPMLLIAIITAFTAQFTKSGSLTVVIMILASMIISTVSIIFPEIMPFMPTSYLSWYQNFSSTLDFSKVINELLYILAYGIIFMFAGSYVFHQKDV